MTREEFQNLTGFTVNPDEYAAIEQLYYLDPNSDKQSFCKTYKNAVSAPNSYSLGKMLHDAGRKLLTNERDLREAKHEIDELAFFMAEQAEKYSSAELREKAIELLGEKKYLCWKLNGKRTLWQADINLIKELINK